MAGCEELPYVLARLPYLNRSELRGKEAEKAADRTIKPVRLWCAHKDALQAARLATLRCCEARPGKGDLAVLAVVDRVAFDVLQAKIKEHLEHIEVLEGALKKLDALDARFLFELSNLISDARGERRQARKVYSSCLGEYIKRYPQKPLQEIHKDPEIVKRARILEDAKAAEERVIEEIEPKIKEITDILAAVRC